MLVFNQKTNKKIIIYLIITLIMIFGIGFFVYKVLNLNNYTSDNILGDDIISGGEVDDIISDDEVLENNEINKNSSSKEYFDIKFIENENFGKFKKINYKISQYEVGNKNPFEQKKEEIIKND